MDFVFLALFAVAVVGLGSAATVLLSWWIPQPVVERAAQHGRFAGLGAVDGEFSSTATAATYRAHIQQEAISVVRT
ncbi:hypothetical protein [Paraburkholderia sp. 40]|uniref:hypothetical protein n=1 Tax=Paraburkholderia sp. 40 TaxID=2991059 RepID=UPI003D20B58A